MITASRLGEDATVKWQQNTISIPENGLVQFCTVHPDVVQMEIFCHHLGMQRLLYFKQILQFFYSASEILQCPDSTGKYLITHMLG